MSIWSNVQVTDNNAPDATGNDKRMLAEAAKIRNALKTASENASVTREQRETIFRIRLAAMDVSAATHKTGADSLEFITNSVIVFPKSTTAEQPNLEELIAAYDDPSLWMLTCNVEGRAVFRLFMGETKAAKLFCIDPQDVDFDSLGVLTEEGLGAFQAKLKTFPVAALVWTEDPSSLSGPRLPIKARPEESPSTNEPTNKETKTTTIHVSNTHHNDHVALNQIKGSFSPAVWTSYNPTNKASPSEVISTMSNELAGWLATNIPSVQSHFNKSSVLRQWVTADVKPSTGGVPSSGNFGIASFSPSGKITSMNELTTAVLLWSTAECRLRGDHMRLLRDALADLILLHAIHPNFDYLGILYLMENRIGRLRTVEAENEIQRVAAAFAFMRTDQNVMIQIQGTTGGRSQSANHHSGSFQHGASHHNRNQAYPYPQARSRGRGGGYRGGDRGRGRHGHYNSEPRRYGAASLVPHGLEGCAHVCYEWVLHNEPNVGDSNPCPSRAGANCEWQHKWPRRAEADIVSKFKAWVFSTKSYLLD